MRASEVGVREVFDLQVEEVNHYITGGGFINRNCFDQVEDFSQSQYEFITIWNRSTHPGQRCRVVASMNPPTTATGLWVMRRWGAWLDPKHPNPAKSGEIRWYTFVDDEDTEVDGPGPHEIEGKMTRARSRTFIRGTLDENPELAGTGYEGRLAGLPKNLRDAYKEGRFEASLKDAPNQAIPTDWVMEAQKRWGRKPPDGVPMCAIGVDVAAGGEDSTVLAPRHDAWFDELDVVPGKNTPYGRDVAGLVVSRRRDKALVIVDMGGGYGGSVYEHLKANDLEVMGYKGAESTTRRSRDGKLRFTNTRSAAYWAFRELLDPGQPGGSSPAALPPDQQLLADLVAPTFEPTPNGIKLETKESVTARLGRSPDKGDAVVMAWWGGPKETSHALEWADQRQRGGRPRVVLSKKHHPKGRR